MKTLLTLFSLLLFTNLSYAQDDAREALNYYLQKADQSGTSYALAQNIAVAAKETNNTGIREWATATAQLRQAEWALLIAAIVLVVWAGFFCFAIWKRHNNNKLIITTLISAIAIAASLWTYQRFAPPKNDAVLVAPIHSQKTSLLSTANVLLSPFPSAEIVTSLPLGTHVQLDPQTSPNNHYLHVILPDSKLTGWLPKENLRIVGK